MWYVVPICMSKTILGNPCESHKNGLPLRTISCATFRVKDRAKVDANNVCRQW